MTLYTKSSIKITGTLLTVAGLYVLIHPSLLFADTFAQIISSRQSNLVSDETRCTNSLADQNKKHASDPPRTRVNNSGPYGVVDWISPQGAPATSSVTVPYGASSVALQLNQLKFICAIIVHNNKDSSYVTDPGSIVTNKNFPNDRSPNADTPGQIDAASLMHYNSQINSATVTYAGVTKPLAAPPGGWSYLSIDRNNGSRYWLSNAVNFAYAPKGGIKSGTVTVNFNETPISSYHTYPGVTQCVSNGTPGPTGGVYTYNGKNNVYKNNSVIGVNPTDFYLCQTVNVPVSFTVAVSPAPKCNGVTLTPGNVEPTEKYTIQANVSYGDQAAAQVIADNGGKVYINITGPASYSESGATVTSGGDLTYTTSALGPSPAGNYTIKYGVSGGTYGSIDCTSSFVIGNLPYFNVLGGDIVAGPGYGASCKLDTTAGITSWNFDNANNTGYFGSGSQQAAIALGVISSFASSLNANGSSSGVGPAAGLTLADNKPSGTTYGGKFGTMACANDYVGAVISNATGGIDYASRGKRTYAIKGPLTLSTASLGNGADVTLKVTGDVYITGTGITYQPYNTVADIPLFQLLVSGNIYISPTVSHLEGVYVAQPAQGRAKTGLLATCATSSGPINAVTDLTGPPNDPYTICNQKLTFVGAVSAAKLELGRTFGSLHSGKGPAESFQYSPELWLAGWAPVNGTTTVGSPQSITSLPPIL